MISWLQHKFATQYSRFVAQDKLIAVIGSFDQRQTAISCKNVLADIGEVVSSSDLVEPDLAKTLLKIRPKTKKAIFEFNFKHPGESQQFLKLVQPEVAILTGLDHTNAQQLGNFEQIIEENTKVISSLPSSGAVILNWDDNNCRKMAEKTVAEVIFFGTDPKKCHLWAGNIALHNLKISFELNYGVERIEINTQFSSKDQIYPMLAAAALGLREGLRLTQLKKSLEQELQLEHQLELFAGFNGSHILDDSYEDSPAKAEQALETLNYLPARRRILVIGEIKRLGSFATKIHKELALKIYKDKLDLVFLAKGEAEVIFEELSKLGFIGERMEQDLTNPQIVVNLLKVLSKGDLVLVVGAKELRLDEVVAKITKK